MSASITARSVAAIQREDRVGYAEAVRRQDGETRSPVDVLPSPEQWAEHRHGEQLTKDEVVEMLSTMDPPEGMGPLTAHQARYIASAVWGRVRTHRDRTYTLAFAHGVDHERREAEHRAGEQDQ